MQQWKGFQLEDYYFHYAFGNTDCIRLLQGQLIKGRGRVDKEKLKAEIERIENIMQNKSSKFIHDELKQYLKLLKKQLRREEND